jgi:hypothetical protein
MEMIPGVAFIAAGLLAGLFAIFTIDYVPRGLGWLSALCAFACVPLLVLGIIAFLVGLGLWLGHPHVWRF